MNVPASAWRLVASVVFVAVFIAVSPSVAHAADCGCTKTIATATAAADVGAIGVGPGQTLCLDPGARTALTLTNVNGSSGKPLVIKNCGGLVDIASSTSAGLQISGTFFHLSGTGDNTITDGIKVRASKQGVNAIQIVGRSSDFEIDHVEVAQAGFAGIMAKLDPRSDCDPTVTRPLGTFTMRNVVLHDLNIHDVGGEGLYIGNSFYNGTLVYNDGSPGCPADKTQYPHEVRGVRIFGNHLKNTGYEAIQVGSAVDDVEIHHNRVELYGQSNVSSQNGGIQLGVGTTGRLYGNVIIGGKGDGIAVQGIGKDYVYDNVVVGAGGFCLNVNVRPTPLSTDIVDKGFLGGVYIVHNTFIDDEGHGVITEYINAAPANVLANNLVVSTAAKWNQLKTNTDWIVSNNVAVTTFAAAGVVDGAARDFHLLPSSPARGAGTSAAAWGVTVDLDGIPLATPPDVGAFQYTPPSSPDAGVANDGGTTAGDAGAAGGAAGPAGGNAGEVPAPEEAGGCNCDLGPRTAANPAQLSLLGVVALLFVARRRTLQRP